MIGIIAEISPKAPASKTPDVSIPGFESNNCSTKFPATPAVTPKALFTTGAAMRPNGVAVVMAKPTPPIAPLTAEPVIPAPKSTEKKIKS